MKSVKLIIFMIVCLGAFITLNSCSSGSGTSQTTKSLSTDDIDTVAVKPTLMIIPSSSFPYVSTYNPTYTFMLFNKTGGDVTDIKYVTNNRNIEPTNITCNALKSNSNCFVQLNIHPQNQKNVSTILTVTYLDHNKKSQTSTMLLNAYEGTFAVNSAFIVDNALKQIIPNNVGDSNMISYAVPFIYQSDSTSNKLSGKIVSLSHDDVTINGSNVLIKNCDNLLQFAPNFCVAMITVPSAVTDARLVIEAMPKNHVSSRTVGAKKLQSLNRMEVTLMIIKYVAKPYVLMTSGTVFLDNQNLSTNVNIVNVGSNEARITLTLDNTDITMNDILCDKANLQSIKDHLLAANQSCSLKLSVQNENNLKNDKIAATLTLSGANPQKLDIHYNSNNVNTKEISYTVTPSANQNNPFDPIIQGTNTTYDFTIENTGNTIINGFQLVKSLNNFKVDFDKACDNLDVKQKCSVIVTLKNIQNIGRGSETIQIKPIINDSDSIVATKDLTLSFNVIPLATDLIVNPQKLDMSGTLINVSEGVSKCLTLQNPDNINAVNNIVIEFPKQEDLSETLLDKDQLEAEDIKKLCNIDNSSIQHFIKLKNTLNPQKSTAILITYKPTQAVSMSNLKIKINYEQQQKSKEVFVDLALGAVEQKVMISGEYSLNANSATKMGGNMLEIPLLADSQINLKYTYTLKGYDATLLINDLNQFPGFVINSKTSTCNTVSKNNIQGKNMKINDSCTVEYDLNSDNIKKSAYIYNSMISNSQKFLPPEYVLKIDTNKIATVTPKEPQQEIQFKAFANVNANPSCSNNACKVTFTASVAGAKIELIAADKNDKIHFKDISCNTVPQGQQSFGCTINATLDEKVNTGDTINITYRLSKDGLKLPNATFVFEKTT